MGKVIDMSEHSNDGVLRSVESALNDAIECIGKEGAFINGKKVLILALDDTDGEYKVTWIQAGMKMSQCMALSAVAQKLFIDEMGY